MASLFAVGLPFTYDGTTNHFATTTGGSATVAAVTSADTVTIDGLSGTGTLTVGATWSCSALTINNASSGLACDGTHGLTVSGAVTLTTGTLNTNGQTCSWGSLASNNSNPRTLTLGASSITITAGGNCWIGGFAAGMTLNAGTSTITFAGLSSGPQFGNSASAITYYNLIFTGGGSMAIGNTTTNLTCNSLTVTNGGVGLGDTFSTCNLTVNGTLTFGSYTNTARLWVISKVVGTPNTITAAALSFSGGIDFMDITGAGAATWTTGASGATYFGDCGGNSGITMTPSAPQAWSGNTTGSWSTAANWTSRVPLPQDDVTVAGLTSGAITVDMPRAGRGVDFTGSSGTIGAAHGFGATNYGSFTIPAAVTVTPASGSGLSGWTVAGRGAYNLNIGAALALGGVVVNAPTGTYTLIGSHGSATATARLTLSNGTLDASVNNVNVSYSQFIIASNTTLRMGSGTWTATAAGIATGSQLWLIPPGVLVAGASTLVIGANGGNAYSFGGGGNTYNNVVFTGGTGASYAITGANTFNYVTVTNPGTVITWPSGVTNTVYYFSAVGRSNGYLSLPGVTGNVPSAPDAAALTPSTALTIDFAGALASWTTVTASLVSKYAAGGTTGYELQLANGKLLMIWGTGSTAPTASSTASVSFTANQVGWVRVSWTIGTGVNFYTSTDGSTWTQLGATVSNTNIFSAASVPLQVGQRSTLTGNLYVGSVNRARLFTSALGSGSGTPVFDADFTTKAFGANSFTESSANAATVTINGAQAQAGDGRMLLNASTPATAATLAKSNGGQVSMDYVTVQDITGSPVSTWYSGTNSVLKSGDTNVTTSYSTLVRTISTAGGNYSTTTAWVEGAVPTASTDVMAAPLSGNLTVDVGSNARSLDLYNYAGTLAIANSVVLGVGTSTAPGSNIAVRFVPAMQTSWGNAASSISVNSTVAAGTVTLTTAGKTMGGLTVNAGTTTTVQFLDGFSQPSLWNVTLTQGGLDTNSQACSWGVFVSTSANVRTLTLGNSQVSVTGNIPWQYSGTNGVLGAGGSTITANNATTQLQFSGGHVYNNFIVNSTGTVNLTNQTCTFTNLTLAGSGKIANVQFGIGFTITGTLTMGGSSTQGLNRLLVSTNTVGSVRALAMTGAAVVINGDVDFQDINITGSPSWTNAGSALVGDCGGNTGLTATAPITNQAITIGAGTTHWSTATWSGTRVPLPQDTITAIVLSATRTLDLDMPRLGVNLDLTGSTGGTISSALGSFTNYGFLTVPATVATGAAPTWSLNGRGTYTLTFATTTLGTLNIQAGSWTLGADLITNLGGSNPGGNLQIALGSSFDSAGHNITTGSITAGNTGTLNMGGGSTWTVNRSANFLWSCSRSISNQGTIVLAGTGDGANLNRAFNGGTQTWANVVFNPGLGSLIPVTGANTFTNLTVSAGTAIQWPTAVTNTITNYTGSGQNFGYLYIPALVAAAQVTTPDATAIHLTSSLTIDAKLNLSSWTGALGSGAILSKFTGASGYELQLSSAGKLVIVINGTSITSTAALTFGANTTNWVRGSWTSGVGANFYTSTDGSTWTQLGTSVGNVVTLAADGTVLSIGARPTATNVGLSGQYYEIKLYSGALGSGSGTPVFDANFATKPFGANSFTESSANAATVTLNTVNVQAGDGRVMFYSSTGGTKAPLSSPNLINLDYNTITDSTAAGNTPFYAGHHSTLSNTTNWVAGTGTLAAQTASLSFAGSALHLITRALRAVSSFIGTRTGVMGRPFSAVWSATGRTLKSAVKALTPAAISPSGANTKRTNIPLTAASAFIGTFMPPVVGVVLNAALSFAGSVPRSVSRKLTGALSFGNLFIAAVHVIIDATLALVGSVRRTTTQRFVATLSLAGEIVRTILSSLAARLAFAAHLLRGRNFFATLSFSAHWVRAPLDLLISVVTRVVSFLRQDADLSVYPTSSTPSQTPLVEVGEVTEVSYAIASRGQPRMVLIDGAELAVAEDETGGLTVTTSASLAAVSSPPS